MSETREKDYEAIGRYVEAIREMETAIQWRDLAFRSLTRDMEGMEGGVLMRDPGDVESNCARVASAHREVCNWAEEANRYAERASRAPVRITRTLYNAADPPSETEAAGGPDGAAATEPINEEP